MLSHRSALTVLLLVVVASVGIVATTAAQVPDQPSPVGPMLGSELAEPLSSEVIPADQPEQGVERPCTDASSELDGVLPSIPAAVAGSVAVFQICQTDASIERAIEQLIAGRGFQVSLRSNGGECAELAVTPTGGSPESTVSQSSSISVSSGGRTTAVILTSQAGATHASIQVTQ